MCLHALRANLEVGTAPRLTRRAVSLSSFVRLHLMDCLHWPGCFPPWLGPPAGHIILSRTNRRSSSWTTWTGWMRRQPRSTRQRWRARCAVAGINHGKHRVVLLPAVRLAGAVHHKLNVTLRVPVPLSWAHPSSTPHARLAPTQLPTLPPTRWRPAAASSGAPPPLCRPTPA